VETVDAFPPPGKLWRAALEELKKQPQLVAFASKGRAIEFDGRTLTVSFTEDERSAAKMLEDDGRRAKLNEAVNKAAGSHVELRLKVTQWSPAQQQFIDKSREVIPKARLLKLRKKNKESLVIRLYHGSRIMLRITLPPCGTFDVIVPIKNSIIPTE